MRRGTTPTHTFTLPIDTALLKTVRVIYAQMGRVILVKTGDDLTLDGYEIRTTLTQPDTLAFNCSKPVEIQVRALSKFDEAMNGDIIQVPVDRCLEDEVLT